jgi:hypothetical protein
MLQQQIQEPQLSRTISQGCRQNYQMVIVHSFLSVDSHHSSTDHGSLLKRRITMTVRFYQNGRELDFETVHRMLITNARETGVDLNSAEETWLSILDGSDMETLWDLFEIETCDFIQKWHDKWLPFSR